MVTADGWNGGFELARCLEVLTTRGVVAFHVRSALRRGDACPRRNAAAPLDLNSVPTGSIIVPNEWTEGRALGVRPIHERITLAADGGMGPVEVRECIRQAMAPKAAVETKMAAVEALMEIAWRLVRQATIGFEGPVWRDVLLSAAQLCERDGYHHETVRLVAAADFVGRCVAFEEEQAASQIHEKDTVRLIIGATAERLGSIPLLDLSELVGLPLDICARICGIMSIARLVTVEGEKQDRIVTLTSEGASLNAEISLVYEEDD